MKDRLKNTLNGEVSQAYGKNYHVVGEVSRGKEKRVYYSETSVGRFVDTPRFLEVDPRGDVPANNCRSLFD